GDGCLHRDRHGRQRRLRRRHHRRPAPARAVGDACLRSGDLHGQAHVLRLLRELGGDGTVSSTGGATIAGGSEHASSTLTPGALNSAVTQSTIASTICAPGWAASVAPSAAYLAALKGKQFRRYHAPGKPASYAEDHLIPIELGGAASDPKNLWPQPRARVRADSLVADALAREVCAGTLPLARAQKVIAALKHAAG